MKKLLLLLSIFAIVLSCSSDETSTPVTPPPAPIVKYTITLSAGEGGTVSTTGGEYESGQTVSVTATPQGEYVFTGWSDGITDATRTITVSTSITLTANFEKRKYALTINKLGQGELSLYTGNFYYGDEVQVFATPNSNHFFSGWRGDIISYQDTLNLNFTSDINLEATFNELNNCLNGDSDVFNGIEFVEVNSIGNKEYNCLIVNKSDGHPVSDGEESVRFELRTESGDCGYTPNGFSDCDTDRSRHEIYEKWIPEMDAVLAKTITYEYNMLIPKVEYFTPYNENSGKPLTVVSQIFSSSEGVNTIDNDINLSQCDSKALLYFVMEGNTLKYLTHKPFTWNQNERITIKENPFDEWIKVKIEIKASTTENGYIKLYINDELINTDNRPTLCSENNTMFNLKLGIYNSYKSYKSKPYLKQVIYYDEIKRSIN